MIQNPGKTLRELLAGSGIQMAPGVYDGISGRVAEQAGFRLGYLSGAGVAAGGVGVPDIGLTGLMDVADSARRITVNSGIPYICDADTGYGNILNVIRTVHELELAGVAAIQLEDQVAPKRCGHLAGKECIPAEEFAQKIRAAVTERSKTDTMIVARTDARAVFGLNEALDRGKRYLDAGADILFIEAPQSLDEVELIAKTFAAQAPLLSNQVIGGKTPRLTAKEAEKLGYKIIIFPDVFAFAASVFMRRIADRLLREGCSWDCIPDAPDSRELFKTMGIDEWYELGDKYKSIK
jgi:2-methylisocitrate lyase-like PEP mutase family enzyme